MPDDKKPGKFWAARLDKMREKNARKYVSNFRQPESPSAALVAELGS